MTGGDLVTHRHMRTHTHARARTRTRTRTRTHAHAHAHAHGHGHAQAHIRAQAVHKYINAKDTWLFDSASILISEAYATLVIRFIFLGYVRGVHVT